MRALSLLLTAAVVAMAHASGTDRPVYNLDEADSLFETFIKDYNRNYKDAADKEQHFNAFKENLKKINEQNKASQHATFGINKFADYTEEERKSMFGLKKP